MAALIAGMILIAVAGVFASIDGMDARLQARFLAAADLQRLRTVVGRALDSLLMSAEAQRPQGGAEPEPEPKRFILATEEAEAVERAGRRARMSGAIGLESPQRLEVVLKRWPVPPGLAAERRADSRRRGVEEPPPVGPGGAVRCAFELRPDEQGGWTMWWRPLPLPDRGGASAREMDPAEDPDAVPLISGLTKCRWTAFEDRQRRSEMTGTWATDLPAYVELEVQTAAGPRGNWVFEIGWGNGPEFADVFEPTGEEATGEAGASGETPPRRQRPGTRPRSRTGGGRGG